MVKPKPLLCCVCLFGGEKTEAVTTVKGYRCCEKHLSYHTSFFRDWEAAQDPKQQPPDPADRKSKKKSKKKGG